MSQKEITDRVYAFRDKERRGQHQTLSLAGVFYQEAIYERKHCYQSRLVSLHQVSSGGIYVMSKGLLKISGQMGGWMDG